jgi:hypothetical protein
MYFNVAPMRPAPPTPGFAVVGLGAFGQKRIVLPKVVPLRSRYATRRRGVGQTTGQDIVNQWSAIDQPNNPFIINNPSLAQGAAANTVSALDEYCANNPTDTTTCSGSSPLPQYVTEANAVGSTLTPQEQAAAAAGQTTPVETGADVGTYTGQISQTYGGPGLIAPTGTTPPVGVTILPVVTISNQSRPGQPFQVGDSWLLTITGAPSQPVTASANFNGSAYGNNTPFGSTDSTGKFSTSGTFSSGQIGNWSEVWTVGGVPAASITFSVAAGAAANTTAPPTTNGAPSGSTAGSACDLSFISGESCLGGLVGTTTALIIGGGLLALFLPGGRK